MAVLDVADDGFNGGAAAHLAFDGGRHAAFLAGGEDLEPVGERGIVTAVAGIGKNAGDAVSDGPLHVRDDGCQGMPVIGVSGQRHGMEGELAASRAMEGGGDRDLHAELIGRVGLSLADAFNLGSMQAVDLPAPLVLPLLQHPAGEVEGLLGRCPATRPRPRSGG